MSDINPSQVVLTGKTVKIDEKETKTVKDVTNEEKKEEVKPEDVATVVEAAASESRTEGLAAETDPQEKPEVVDPPPTAETPNSVEMAIMPKTDMVPPEDLTVPESKEQEEDPISNFDEKGFNPDGVAKKVIETATDPDLGINQVAIVNAMDEKAAADTFSKLYPDEKSFEKAVEDPLSFWNLFVNAGKYGWNYQHLRDYISTLVENKVEQKLTKFKETEFADKVASRINTKAVDVTGAEAMNAFMSAINGFLKVNLMNSGFWVSLHRPQIAELQAVFDALELEQREVGYMIGAHYALCADMHLKKKFLESLINFRIINGSNLEGIYKDDNFYQALSYHDYETLVHAVLTLMSRSKGLRTRVACPQCHKIDLVEDIDIGSCKVINRDLITDEVRAWWNQKDANGKPVKRTLKDVKRYQKEILKNTHSFVEKFSHNNLDVPMNIRMNLRVPTMAEYFDDGERFINKITKLIDERDVGSSERRKLISANLGAHVYQMITPWVASIEQLDDEGNVVVRTSDREPIAMVLDTTAQDKTEAIRPLTELEKFTANTRFVWIGMFSMECPHCHAKPDFGFDQFFPLEVQTIFFGHLYRALPAEITQNQMGEKE